MPIRDIQDLLKRINSKYPTRAKTWLKIKDTGFTVHEGPNPLYFSQHIGPIVAYLAETLSGEITCFA